MSYLKLEVPADTIRSNIVSGLYALKLIPENMEVAKLNFGDLNTDTGMIPIEIRTKKEVHTTVTRPK